MRNFSDILARNNWGEKFDVDEIPMFVKTWTEIKCLQLSLLKTDKFHFLLACWLWLFWALYAASSALLGFGAGLRSSCILPFRIWATPWIVHPDLEFITSVVSLPTSFVGLVSARSQWFKSSQRDPKVKKCYLLTILGSELKSDLMWSWSWCIYTSWWIIHCMIISDTLKRE